MTSQDWPAVRDIYAAGIATGNATLEREPPDHERFDASHRPDCRFIACATADERVLGWTALSRYSSREVYEGIAWESVYVAADVRGQGIGRGLLDSLVPASEAAGVWTLLAGVLADNAPSLALHVRAGFRQVGVQHRLGQDGTGRWRDVVMLERRSEIIGRGP